MRKAKSAGKTTKGTIAATSESVVPADYAACLAGLKDRISSARQRATLSVNQELVRLYHHIGAEILERQTRQGWGAKVIDRLATDLREAFPEMKGFSSSNLKYMWFFAQMCPGLRIGQQPADQLPWFHLVAEYALSGIDKPIGVAEYQLVRALPKPLDTALPTIEQIERELSTELGVRTKKKNEA
jgi:hypothetical protein